MSSLLVGHWFAPFRVQCRGIREDQTIAECELGVVAIVGEHDVAQLMSQNCRQSCLVGKRVDQTAADHDGVADGEALDRCSQQYAAPHLRLDHKVGRASRWASQESVPENWAEAVASALAVQGH
jgi:hypothetical protein